VHQHVFAAPHSAGPPTEGQGPTTPPDYDGNQPNFMQPMMHSQPAPFQHHLHHMLPGNAGLPLHPAHQHLLPAPHLAGPPTKGQVPTARPDYDVNQHNFMQPMMHSQPAPFQHLLHHMLPGSNAGVALHPGHQHALSAQQLTGPPTGGQTAIPAVENAVVASSVSTKQDVTPKRTVPRVRPKRALTGYNIFFKDQRAKILAELTEEMESLENDLHTSYGTKRERRNRPHGKMGFEAMAKKIGKRWKEIEPEESAYYKSLAAADKKRFDDELALFTKEECDEREAMRVALEASVPEETKKLYFAREH
jgi:hypothetical protein